MRSLLYLFFFLSLPSFSYSQAGKSSGSDRNLWLQYMDKVCRPVFSSLAEGSLRKNMPVVLSARIDNRDHRTKVAYLEAFGRSFCGIAPWLNIDEGDAREKELRAQYRAWALKAVANAVDPKSPDYLQWQGGQPLVDASFFTLGLIRAPWIWNHLDEQHRVMIVNALLSTRKTVPVYSNWILFSSMIECFFAKYGYDYDALRVEYGMREFFEHWYIGDGMFSDGNHFNLDYYNSFVIQPYLSTLLETFAPKNGTYRGYGERFAKIRNRYAEIQEKMINGDGTFPATGRSIIYRCGAFHHLANEAFSGKLPPSLKPQAVRSALTAVLEKTLGAPSTFRSDGWLNIGLHGSQPSLAEFYITTGSSYLCCAVFLPLGLSPADDFWSKPREDWSSRKIWKGEDYPADHAL